VSQKIRKQARRGTNYKGMKDDQKKKEEGRIGRNKKKEKKKKKKEEGRRTRKKKENKKKKKNSKKKKKQKKKKEKEKEKEKKKKRKRKREKETKKKRKKEKKKKRKRAFFSLREAEFNKPLMALLQNCKVSESGYLVSLSKTFKNPLNLYQLHKVPSDWFTISASPCSTDFKILPTSPFQALTQGNPVMRNFKSSCIFVGCRE